LAGRRSNQPEFKPFFKINTLYIRDLVVERSGVRVLFVVVVPFLCFFCGLLADWFGCLWRLEKEGLNGKPPKPSYPVL
jgi:hypothetical protein